MKNIYRFGKEEITKKMNIYLDRKNTAILKGYANDSRYKSVILEFDLRINAIKNVLLCIDFLPNHLSDTKELLKNIVAINGNLFKVIAGHNNEEDTLKVTMEKIIQDNNYAELWNNMNSALEMFDGGYDFNNKVQLYVDVINYLAQSVLFFISFREIICKIDSKGEKDED